MRRFNRIDFVIIPSYIELPCLYRLPSQTGDIFETLADNLELTWDTLFNKNQFLLVALGDFNTKTTNWYKNDKILLRA